MTIGEYFGKDFPVFYKECRYSLQREGWKSLPSLSKITKQNL